MSDTPVSKDLGPSPGKNYSFPLLQSRDAHMRELLENSFGYLAGWKDLVDPASGYMVEGWNQEPENGLFLRSFTQLTAIGSWIEILANIAVGYADNPYITREDAVRKLTRAVKSLREDQNDPMLSDRGLLVNFLDLEGGRRKGPLEETVDKQKFIDAFGDGMAKSIWSALQEKGWITPEDNGLVGRIRRSEDYGHGRFSGPLKVFTEEKTEAKIMRILDSRAVLVVFGDNVNLTASIAKSIGALLRPELGGNPEIVKLREEMELFIESQKEGYTHLYDARTGTFYFGWDAGKKRFMGWDDGAGNWVTGQMNYFINEFRGPWIFAVVRYGLPMNSIINAGFKMKPYNDIEGNEIYGLCAWDGSAFQLMGFNVFMQELCDRGWKANLENMVDIELDYSSRNGLPGLLSESYSGNGTEYTGLIGISDVAVTEKKLINYAPSLYSLGVAYMISPDKTECFLAGRWPAISSLFTEHGPWEGYNTRTNESIKYQTTSHTLSLILAGIGSAPENMSRYIGNKKLSGQLDNFYKPGTGADMLSGENQIIPWTADASPLKFKMENKKCSLNACFDGIGGLSFVVPYANGVNLSNSRLRLGYHSNADIENAHISFKRINADGSAPPSIPVEIFLRIKRTEGSDGNMEIVLPATPALSGIKEVSIVFGMENRHSQIDISLTAFEFQANSPEE